MSVLRIDGSKDLPVNGMKGTCVPVVAVFVVLLKSWESGSNTYGGVQAAGDGDVIDVELDLSIGKEGSFMDWVGEVGDFSRGKGISIDVHLRRQREVEICNMVVLMSFYVVDGGTKEKLVLQIVKGD